MHWTPNLEGFEEVNYGNPLNEEKFNKAKEYIYNNIFNKKYKIEKKINYQRTQSTMLKQLRKYFNPNYEKIFNGKNPHTFIIEYLKWIKDNNIDNIYKELIKPENLLFNRIKLKEPLYLTLPSGRIYKMQDGSKIMRFLQTITKEYNLDLKAFAEFKLVHSLIVNAQERTERIIITMDPWAYANFFKGNSLGLYFENSFIVHNKEKTWYDLYLLNKENQIINMTQNNPDITNKIKESIYAGFKL